MKKNILFTLILFCSITLHAQNFTGQWKGNFMDKSTSFMSWGGDLCDYVLELNASGNKISGFSYTYFNATGKRYYTICRLEGFIKKGSKYVEVREVERTKTNVPNDIKNCFQIHRLKLFANNEKEDVLSGDWIPAPDQDGDCGYGTTILTRRVLKTTTKPSFNNATARTDKPKIPQTKITVKPKPIPPPIVKSTAPITKPKPTIVTKEPTASKPEVVVAKPITPKKEIATSNFEKRDNNLVQTIEVENETFKVDFYDNGDIDGDTISVFFNGKLVEAHKRLTDKPLTLTLAVDPNIIVNELIMYAENLGSIPPNTAVMIVTDGGKRYEVRIASDLKKSGVIRFVHKPK
jgi:archaellum component FlaF (FlaF/FlaG flagellin family)